MIIEIAENDFKVIQDKIGDIRATALIAKMVTQEGCRRRLEFIAGWANEITALLHKGAILKDKDLPKFKDIIGLYADPPTVTTKFIERFDYWICEKCGYKWESESNILPAEWSIDSPDKYFKCQGCQREIIKFVPLVREGG